MGSIIETVATAILILFAMILLLHMLRRDATKWLFSKMQIKEDVTTPTGLGNGRSSTGSF